MSTRSSSIAAFGLVLGIGICVIAPACSRPLAKGDGGDASQDRSESGSAGTGGMATAGTSGGAGNGGTFGIGGTIGAAGTGTGGAAGISGVAGSSAAAGTSGAAGTTGRGGGVGTAGTTGVAGRGGSSVAGTTGGAGRGGTSGTAGGTGGSASGGRGGAGGLGGPGPECMTAADCKLVDDCCTCTAIPVGASAPPCSSTCKQNACEARQLRPGAVDCVVGHCVAGFACNTSQVTCKVAAPSCPAGDAPGINESGNCYTGACVPATECSEVTGCGACDFSTQACVSYQTQLGNQHHCVTLPPQCGGGCDCLGASSCLPPYRSCTNYSGIRGIACSCPNC